MALVLGSGGSSKNNDKGFIGSVISSLPKASTTHTPTSGSTHGGTGGNLNGGPVKSTNSGILNNIKKVDPTPSGGSGGGGGGGGSSYSMPDYSSSNDDILNQIKALLNEQKAAADKYYKSMYEQQIAQNRQTFENNRDQINLNYMRGNRYLQNQYGNSVSGSGLTNRARNNMNWQSNLASNRQNYTNNDATALAQYNSGLANNASNLAQGWYNYVLPVMSNRQQTMDDYNYRRYLASL